MEEKVIIKSKNALQGFDIILDILLICTFIYFLGMFCFWIQDDFADFLLFTTPPFIILVVLFIIRLNISKCELVVSNKRIYGKAKFGRRVDLPLDSISAVGTSSMYGIDVGTSSGKIKFKFIKNNNEIHKIISDLLIKRQKQNAKTIISQEIHQSSADELKKFKELLDSGVITQEEFEAKKKQLLGL